MTSIRIIIVFVVIVTVVIITGDGTGNLIKKTRCVVHHARVRIHRKAYRPIDIIGMGFHQTKAPNPRPNPFPRPLNRSPRHIYI